MTNKNKKGFTLVEIMIVVVIIGLLAAMAVPAFNKVRQESRESTIKNNLRQIASAGQRYLLDDGSVTSVSYTELVDAGYFKTIDQVADEDYEALSVYESGATEAGDAEGDPDVELSVLTVTMANGDTVTYPY